MRDLPGSLTSNWVFIKKNGSKYRRVDSEVQAFGNKIGIKNFHQFTYHANRKEGITKQATLAGDDHTFQKTVMGQSRHACITSQQRYVQSGEEGLARFMDKMEGKEVASYGMKDARKVTGIWAGMMWKKEKVEELQMENSKLLTTKYHMMMFIKANGLMDEWEAEELNRRDDDDDDDNGRNGDDGNGDDDSEDNEGTNSGIIELCFCFSFIILLVALCTVEFDIKLRF